MTLMNEGPDCVIETNELRTWDRDGVVKIRIADDGIGASKPKSIIDHFTERCTFGKEHTAMAVKREGKWIKWTYNLYYEEVKIAAKAMLKLGLQRFHAVSIFGFNSPEWFIGSVSAIFAGGLSNGLYPTNSGKMNLYIMQDSKTDILLVEDDKALNTLWDYVEQVDTLKKIVQWSGKPVKPGVLSWKEFYEIGLQESDEILTNVHKTMAVNQCATLVYTSGTTGNPKGTMLSHDNIIFTTELCLKIFNWEVKNEIIVSYLPLSHVAGLLFDLWVNVANCSTVYFADRTALKGTLIDTLKEVRPTELLGVPRVWEKIMEGIQAKGKETKGLKKKLATACKEAGLQYHLHGKESATYRFGQKVIYPKIHKALGLDRCKNFYSGAAPLSIDCIKYFLSLDIKITEVYGMSETTGPHFSLKPNDVKIGSVGVTLPSFNSRLKDSNDQGEGELCMFGRNIMMGYMGKKEKTFESIDAEGWIHSGDLAKFDKDGYCYITGRIKELLITAGGENIAPIPIEDQIKNELPVISNAILIGDKKKFLSIFLTLKTEIDNVTEKPTKNLTQLSKDWCRSLGRNVKTVDDILRGPDPVIMAAIQTGIDKVNTQAISNANRVQKWMVLPTDLSISGNELGPTLKLKRFAFCKKYEKSIEQFYK